MGLAMGLPIGTKEWYQGREASASRRQAAQQGAHMGNPDVVIMAWIIGVVVVVWVVIRIRDSSGRDL